MPKSRLLILALALALLGCGGKDDPAPQPPPPAKDSAPAAPDDKAPPQQTAPAENAPPAQAAAPASPPAAWTNDAKGMTLPATPVAGQVNGRPVAFDQVQLANVGVLTLRLGKEQAPVAEVRVPLPVKKYEVPAGQTFEVTPEGGPAVPVIFLRWQAGEKDTPSAEFSKDYLLHLEFGQPAAGKLPGRIYLALPDAAKSFVAGTFTADVEPDYSKLPRPDEAPFVTGKVTLKGRDKYDLRAGVAVARADGSPFVNLVGSEIQPNSDFALTSDTFAPQLTTLACDADGGCTYRHVKLPPGRYLIYARLGDRFLDGRWVEVKEGTAVPLDFSLDAATAGSLEVTLPKDAKGGVRLIPLDENGKLPDLGDALETVTLAALDTEVPAKDGKVVLDGLRPGAYRVLAGAAQKDVTIKAKEAAKVDLSSAPGG